MSHDTPRLRLLGTYPVECGVYDVVYCVSEMVWVEWEVSLCGVVRHNMVLYDKM